MRKYEYLYIIDPQEEVVTKSIDSIKEHYKNMGVVLLKEEEIGKKHLAYAINKKTDGFYYITQIEVDDFTKLQDFEKELKLNSDVIRFMKVKI